MDKEIPGSAADREIERLLRDDAARTPSCDARRAAAGLRPYILRACIRMERRRRQRRQAAVMAAAAVPVAVIMLLAGFSAVSGNAAPLRALAWPFGAFSACALLTLPIIEHFMPKPTPSDPIGGIPHAE